MAHSAVKENYIEKLAFAWYPFLPFYFVLDKQNYAHYGSFCLTMLLNIEATYPGLNTLIAEKRIYVQGQIVIPWELRLTNEKSKT